MNIEEMGKPVEILLVEDNPGDVDFVGGGQPRRCPPHPRSFQGEQDT